MLFPTCYDVSFVNFSLTWHGKFLPPSLSPFLTCHHPSLFIFTFPYLPAFLPSPHIFTYQSPLSPLFLSLLPHHLFASFSVTCHFIAFFSCGYVCVCLPSSPSSSVLHTPIHTPNPPSPTTLNVFPFPDMAIPFPLHLSPHLTCHSSLSVPSKLVYPSHLTLNFVVLTIRFPFLWPHYTVQTTPFSIFSSSSFLFPSSSSTHSSTFLHPLKSPFSPSSSYSSLFPINLLSSYRPLHSFLSFLSFFPFSYLPLPPLILPLLPPFPYPCFLLFQHRFPSQHSFLLSDCFSLSLSVSASLSLLAPCFPLYKCSFMSSLFLASLFH